MPALETAMRQAIHRLGVLIGSEPKALLAELSVEGALPPVPPEVPLVPLCIARCEALLWQTLQFHIQ